MYKSLSHSSHICSQNRKIWVARKIHLCTGNVCRCVISIWDISQLTNQPVVLLPQLRCGIALILDNFVTAARDWIVGSDTAFHQNSAVNLYKLKTGFATCGLLTNFTRAHKTYADMAHEQHRMRPRHCKHYKLFSQSCFTTWSQAAVLLWSSSTLSRIHRLCLKFLLVVVMTDICCCKDVAVVKTPNPNLLVRHSAVWFEVLWHRGSSNSESKNQFLSPDNFFDSKNGPCKVIDLRLSLHARVQKNICIPNSLVASRFSSPSIT